MPFFIREINNIKTTKLLSNSIINAKGNIVSSSDESTIYYTYDCSGLVLAIYNNREDIERTFPEADIKSIRKNNFDCNHPLFR